MTYGLKVLNSSGTVQIDNNYRNMVFIQKYTVTLTKSDNVSGIYSVEKKIPFSNHPDSLIAVRYANEADNSRPLSVSLKSQNWYINSYTATSSATPVDVIVYVFSFSDTDVKTPAGKWGLVVYDDNENITFDSNRKYLRILAPMIKQTGGMLYGDATDYVGFEGTVNTSVTYAYLVTSSACTDELQISDPDDGTYASLRLVQDSYMTFIGNNLKVQVKQTINHSNIGNASNTPVPFADTNSLLCAFLVDVTNY